MPAPLFPGRPGRGHDPTAGFTDMQWYLYHQDNVAFFAAFTATDVTMEEAISRLGRFVAALPHVTQGFRGAPPPGEPLPDAVLRQLVTIETVPDLSGLPDAWLNSPDEVYARDDLPFFRLRVARRAGGPDASGRHCFFLVRLSHAFAEGQDSALLSRSQNAAHAPVASADRVPAGTAVAARLFGGFAAAMHLVVARLWQPHPGRIVLVTRAFPRRLFFAMARRLGVSQRALFAGLAAHAVADGATGRTRRRRISTTYSAIDHGGGQHRDSFMRMRMKLVQFDDAPDFASFVRGIDARFAAAEDAESGFNAEMNAAATHAHRRLSRLIPWAYSPRVFRFMPYDMVFGLIPPHRLGGPLVEGVLEPVFAGALVPGIVGCVVVPGREQITFAFSFRAEETGRIAAFDQLVAALSEQAAEPGMAVAN